MAVKKAYYRFVPIWFDTETCEIEPRKFWLAPILDLVILIDMDIIRVKEFKIFIELDDDAKNN